MDALEEAQRVMVCAEARRWIGTPYVHQGNSREGVDCGMLLVRVFVDVGLCEPFDPRPYARDFHLHRDDERYLGFVGARTSERPADQAPMMGDVILWRHGRSFSHGGIVTEWPHVVHAYAPERRVVEAELGRTPLDFDRRGHPRQRAVYSYWPVTGG